MADQKISQLTALTGANTAADDVLAIVDTNAAETKKIRADELFKSLGAGTAAAPAIAPAGDQNTGIFFPAADTIAFSEGGVESMRITAAGNVGIGTTSPNARITVKASGNAYTNGALALQASASGTSYLTNVNGTLFVSNDGATDHLVLTSSGDVGIGTSNPSVKLQVQAGTVLIGTTAGNAKPQLLLGSAGPNYGQIQNDSTGLWSLGYGASPSALGTPVLTWNSSGNVGIGNSSPATALHIKRTSGNSELRVDYNGTNVGQIVAASNGNLYFGTQTGSGIVYIGNTANASALGLDSSGNLGLGVTPSAWGSTAKAITIKSSGSAIEGSFCNSGADNSTVLANNAYYNAGWKYVWSGGSYSASRYDIDNGAHKWYNAPSGTAGNAITFTQAMTLNASGNLGIGTTSPSYKIDLGQQLLSSPVGDSKVVSRLGNVVTVKRKFGEIPADTTLFDIQCGAASANTQGSFEITVFSSGKKTGASLNRPYTAKWYVIRSDAGTFTITQLYQAGTSGQIALVANGNSLNINAIFSVISGGGCFAEIKGMIGPASEALGVVETGFTVVLP